MMGPETEQRRVILSLDYGPRSEWLRPSEIEAMTATKAIPRAPGWSTDRGYHVPVTLEVVDLESGVHSSTTTEATQVVFVDGARSAEVEIVPLPDDTFRLWADRTMSRGEPTAVPLGAGYVGGPTAVVDAGGALLRATLSDGNPDAASGFEDGSVERPERLQEEARQFMAILQ